MKIRLLKTLTELSRDPITSEINLVTLRRTKIGHFSLPCSGRNFDDSDSETDENASTSLMEESENDSEAASELAIFQVLLIICETMSRKSNASNL